MTPGSRYTQILDAARQILEESGLKAVSVRAVAARAGVGASTMRYYFPTQATLHETIIRASVRTRISDLHIRDTSMPARTRLTDCVTQFLPIDQSELDAAAHVWQVQLERGHGVTAAATGITATATGIAAAATTATAATATTTTITTDLRTAMAGWLADEGLAAIRAWAQVLGDEGVPLARSPEGVADILGTYADGLLSGLIFDSRFTINDARARLADLVALLLPASPTAE